MYVCMHMSDLYIYLCIYINTMDSLESPPLCIFTIVDEHLHSQLLLDVSSHWGVFPGYCRFMPGLEGSVGFLFVAFKCAAFGCILAL